MRLLDGSAARIAGVYLVVAVGWIVGSDLLLERVAPELMRVGQTVKGLGFVGMSALLIYVLMARSFSARAAAEERRARLERQLSAAARFEAIGQLATGIAHDFNNLLTAIGGNIESFLQQWPPEGRPEELVEAGRSADRAAQLTRQLLAFGRRQVMRPEMVDVNAVIRDMATLLHRLIGREVRIVTELGSDLRSVVVDRGRLEQVVMNLAINARDAMPAGGKLYIRTSNAVLDAEDVVDNPFPVRPGRYVRLEVVDDGMGMSPEVRARIFEPFYTTKPKEVGTGLGLATVYGIVKQSGGYITVESEPGFGSRFSVYLPEAKPGRLPLVHESAAVSEAAAGAPVVEVAEAQGSPTGTETLLVVDDDRSVRELMARILARRGYAVLEAPDGPEALEVLRELNGQVDLVITDASMPRMRGLDLAATIHARTPALPVLVVSGHDEESLRSSLPYLAKPFTHDQLARRVRALLDARRPTGQS